MSAVRATEKAFEAADPSTKMTSATLPIVPGKEPEFEAFDATEHDRGFMPDTVPRGCTDCLCFAIFLVCVSVGVYTAMTTDLNFVGANYPLYYLTDYNGSLCGAGKYKDRPYQYTCTEPAGEMSQSLAIAEAFVHGTSGNKTARMLGELSVCVAECPKWRNASILCPVKNGDSTITITSQKTYPSSPNMGLLCLPNGPILKAQLVKLRFNFYADALGRDELVMWLSSTHRTDELIPYTIAVGFVTCLGFLYLMKGNTVRIIHAGIVIISLISGIVAAVLLSASDWGDWAAGGCCLMICLFFVSICMCKLEQLDAAAICVQQSAGMIFSVPAIPPACLCVALSYYWMVRTMCRFFLHCIRMSVAGKEEMEDGRFIKFVFLMFMTYWLTKFLRDVVLFAAAYTAQLWWFQGPQATSSWQFLRAMAICIRYHTGTIAFGSFANIALIPIRMTVAWVGCFDVDRDKAEEDEDESPSNMVNTCLVRNCSSALGCFEALRPFRFTFVVDLAMNGKRFCDSANFTDEVLHSRPVVRRFLEGCTRIFMLVGLFMVGGTTGLFASMVLRSNPSYNDHESANYVIFPHQVRFVSTVIGATIAFPFMNAVDGVAKAFLYAFILEKRRQPDTLDRAEGMAASFFHTMFDPIVHVGEYIAVCARPRAKPPVDTAMPA
eukprot:TRINITY_DN51461_c0_g1_i1.p1 TRINITY_DN51461_c0_g1~~TRINITY_DN51461_c0_g1_i1.p1  ORF type:complete len:664 (-),score=106.73 TRINITY_DN51461_c0_g1_i1:374-2365(-)